MLRRVVQARILQERGQCRDREIETELIIQYLQPGQEAKSLGVAIELEEVVVLLDVLTVL